MVGTVIFKDFETGSYENMRVTMYGGNSYADIDRAQEFSSCIVSLERKSAVYDVLTSDNAPRLSMKELFELCQRAREYLYTHDWVTMADFAVSGTDILFRCRSSKSGIYSPIDIHTIFDIGSRHVYKLCFEDDSAYLNLSVRCHAVNYCLKVLLGIEDDVFGISGRGVYMDVSLIKAKRAYTPKLKKTDGLDASFSPCTHSHMELISSFRSLKLRALERAKRSFFKSKSLAEICLQIMEDEYIKRASREFTDELLDYLYNYDFCFEAKSHIKYISIHDALYLIMTPDASDDIAKRAASLSANMKLRQELPCADYYDGRGRAYNI